MIMYSILILFLVFFIKRYEFSGKIIFNKSVYWTFCIIFVLMSGLRYRLGVDSVMYESAFSYYPTIDKYNLGYEYCRDAKDIFWAILNSLCKTIHNSFVTVQFIMGIFTNIVVFWFVKKHCSRPFLAILLYLVTLWPLITFEALREGLSVTFYIWALDALISKKSLTVYYLRVWPAIFCHTFGFMTLFFPLIQILKPNKTTIYFTIVASLSILIFGYMLGDIVMAYVTLDSIAGDKLNMYFESDLYGSNMWSIGGILSIVIGYVLPISAMAFIIVKKDNPVSNWLFPYLIFMLLVSLFKISLPVFYRFFNYFYLVLVIGMCECLNTNMLNRNFRILGKIAVFLFVFMVLYYFSKPSGVSKYPSIYRYYPYNSIITKDYNYKTEQLLPE